MFKTILVPIDPSRPFAAANDYACSLAGRFGSQVVANYIVDEELVAGAGEAVAALDDAMEHVGQDAMERFVDEHQDLGVRKLLSYGHTATVIFQSVLATGADLVVVGGYSGAASPKVWGSTVMDIVKHDERPTFVVRAPSRVPASGDAIVVPFDGSERAQANLPRIAKLAQEFSARLDLVYVAKKHEAERALHMLQMGAAIAQGVGVECEIHCIQATRLSSKGRSILKHARQQRAPLIALSRLGETSTRTGYSSILHWLLTHSEIPVWVVRK